MINSLPSIAGNLFSTLAVSFSFGFGIHNVAASFVPSLTGIHTRGILLTEYTAIGICWWQQKGKKKRFRKWSIYLNTVLALSLPKVNLIKPRKLLNPELSNEIKGVTTQMKVLIEYMVVLIMLLLNTVHVFANFYVQFGQRNSSERVRSQTSVTGRTKRTKR